VAWVVLAVGVVASLLGAWQWKSFIQAQQRQQVRSGTHTALATLSSSIQRDEDLAEIVSSLVATGVPLTNVHFQQLVSHIGGVHYAGILGLAFIQVVPAAELPSYETAVLHDQPFGMTVSAVTLDPAGERAQYCLTRLGATNASAFTRQVRAMATTLSTVAQPGYDYCAGPYAPAFLAAANSGHQAVTPFAAALPGSALSQLFEIIVPVYRSGAPVATVAERQAALLGWAGGLFTPSPVLSPVIAADRSASVVLSYTSPGEGSLVVAQGGTGLPALRANHTSPVALQADGSWRAQVSVVPTTGSATIQALGVLADLLIIFLLVLMLFLLFRSRANALSSVEEKDQELHHRALHDPLTNLANRDLILDRAEQMLARGRRDGVAVAALFVDLDNFRGVNDTLGHSAGDEVLAELAGRLEQAVGSDESIGRLGGDEFVILAEGTSLADGAEAIAQRLLDAVSAPFVLDHQGAGLRISASIGIASGVRDSAEDLLRDADIALNAAKAAGKGRALVFEPAMHTAVRGRLDLELDLRLALEDDQFFLVYQPIFDLLTLRPTGVEALLRWRHPTRGVVAPMEFIPLLEETGMIVAVGREVLHKACAQTRLWRSHGLDLDVAVNASAIQLDSDTLDDDVDRALTDSALEPRFLTIEMTETALMRDASETVRRLRSLKGLGVRLAIDDFGTGYSSLAYLQQFPIDVIKVDRSFITAMTTPGGGALVHSMIELAKALDLEIVAEGIEEDHQLSQLQAESCDTGQGFLLARPLEVGDVEPFFAHLAAASATSRRARGSTAPARR
jgi:diguanylate cyclase (GGDEF)-like protein